MSLPMTLIIIVGEIDLSVESIVGLTAAILGALYSAGIPIEIAIVVVLVVGALGGLLNGVLVDPGRTAVPRGHPRDPRAVPGLALVVLGSNGVSDFPDWFTTFGFGNLPGRPSHGHSSSSSRSRSSWASSSTAPGSGVSSTRSARTQARRASPASGSTRVKLLLFVLSGTGRRAGGGHPGRPDVECASRRRTGLTLDVDHDRAAGRRRHLRRPGLDPGRRSRGFHIGRAAERPAADERVRPTSRASPSGCS